MDASYTTHSAVEQAEVIDLCDEEIKIEKSVSETSEEVASNDKGTLVSHAQYPGVTTRIIKEGEDPDFEAVLAKAGYTLDDYNYRLNPQYVRESGDTRLNRYKRLEAILMGRNGSQKKAKLGVHLAGSSLACRNTAYVVQTTAG